MGHELREEDIEGSREAVRETPNLFDPIAFRTGNIWNLLDITTTICVSDCIGIGSSFLGFIIISFSFFTISAIALFLSKSISIFLLFLNPTITLSFSHCITIDFCAPQCITITFSFSNCISIALF